MSRADFPDAFKSLIAELKRLPGVGPRSAERIAVWLMQNPKAEPQSLAAALETASATIHPCPTCGFFATADSCGICDDPVCDVVSLMTETCVHLLSDLYYVETALNGIFCQTELSRPAPVLADLLPVPSHCPHFVE